MPSTVLNVDFRAIVGIRHYNNDRDFFFFITMHLCYCKRLYNNNTTTINNNLVC